MSSTPHKIKHTLKIYNPESLYNADYVRFLDGNDVYTESAEYKIALDKKAVFDNVLDIVGDKPSFKWFRHSFYVESTTMFVQVLFDAFGSALSRSGLYSVMISSTEYEEVIKFKTELDKRFSGLGVNSIVWAISNPTGGIIYKEMDIATRHNEASSNFYPWLNGINLEEYFKHYLESEETVLLLTGQPGTGKTTFIKDLLVKNNLNAVITYDEKLMKDDQFFLDFLTDNDGETTGQDVLIIEDADALIEDRDRTENNILSKLLNVSDGLIKNISKKIIFSTNITDITRIDDALIRPGRCYDVLDFRKLTYDEAVEILKVRGIERELVPGRHYTLAELFSSNGRVQTTNKFKIGIGR